MSDQVCRYCDYPLGDGKYLCDPTEPNVCEPCQNLAELEIKIKETKMMLAGLVNEHQKLKEQANHNHDRLTGRLPPEIVGYIFELCTPADAMEIRLRSNVPLSTIRAPFVLSNVCRRWRTIAHSIPQLWNTLLLYFQSSKPRISWPSPGEGPGPLFVQQWIDRAGLLPLSISIAASITHVNEIAGKEIINVLNQYVDRWVHLKYDGTSALLHHFSRYPVELPQLRTLHVNNEFRDSRYALNLYPKQLINLSIIGIRLAVAKFDWRHLIQLEMGQMQLSECFEALRRAPRLTHYIVTWSTRESGEREKYPLPQHPIVHPNIHYLEFARTILYQQVLQNLSCPSLTTLVFKLANDSIEMPMIVEFLRRSVCSLERLSLVRANISTPDVVSLCEGIPTLQHLHIESYFYYLSPVSTLFSLLAKFSDGKPRYLPALCSLALKINAMDNWTLVPKIFGTPTSHSSTYLGRHRHALESVAIYVEKILSSDLVSAIGEETLGKIVRLREAGVQWKIQSKDDTIDLTGT